MKDKSILVINKSDLGTEYLNSMNFTTTPLTISIKEDNNLDKLIEVVKSKLKKQFFKIR